MNELRLILLVAGALLVVGVYAYTRWGARNRDSAQRRSATRDPSLGTELALDEDVPDDMPPLRAPVYAEDETEHPEAPVHESVNGIAKPAAEREEKIIVLNILPQESAVRFPGADLLDVFDRAGLEYGQYNIFHRIKETSDGPQSVFSLASATEPGSFDITTMADESFRGLTLFMQLPGPVRGVDAFADMLATARRIAEQIRGDVKDRQRSTLTRQTAHHIREEIVAFETRLKLAQPSES